MKTKYCIKNGFGEYLVGFYKGNYPQMGLEEDKLEFNFMIFAEKP